MEWCLLRVADLCRELVDVDQANARASPVCHRWAEQLHANTINTKIINQNSIDSDRDRLNVHLLRMCLLVIPFSVIVSFIVNTFVGRMYDCCSMTGNGGASNELQTVLFVCVLPSYSSIAAVIPNEYLFSIYISGRMRRGKVFWTY